MPNATVTLLFCNFMTVVPIVPPPQGNFRKRALEWVAILWPRESSQPRDRNL